MALRGHSVLALTSLMFHQAATAATIHLAKSESFIFLLLTEEKLNQNSASQPRRLHFWRKLKLFKHNYTLLHLAAMFKLLRMKIFQFIGWQEGAILYSLLGSQMQCHFTFIFLVKCKRCRTEISQYIGGVQGSASWE